MPWEQKPELFQFGSLTRIVRAKNTWKSSATAIKEIPKGELSFPARNSKRLFVSKAKTFIGFGKLKSIKFLATTKYFHLAGFLPKNDDRTTE